MSKISNTDQSIKNENLNENYLKVDLLPARRARRLDDADRLIELATSCEKLSIKCCGFLKYLKSTDLKR
jgi:hypothetical protein